jgi:hypothetical protein
MVGRGNLVGVKIALCAALALTVPFPVAALTVQECSGAADIMAPHAAEGDYMDLGASLITYRDGGCVDGGCWNYVNFVSCRSGETLAINVHNATRSEAAETIVREAVASPTRYTFADVKGLLLVAGFESELTTAAQEICACKALYPQDRRGKTPYVYEPLIEE